MPDPRYSAFDVPLVAFGEFTLEERVWMLRANLPAWKYGKCSAFIGAHVAAGIEQFLEHGGDLARILGLRPARGSRNTAQRVDLLRERDTLLVRLSVAVGSDVRARRILDGDERCPRSARALVQQLKAHSIPRSKAAFSRAKVSRHQR